MPSFKSGDRVRVVTRAVTEEDRKKNQYFDHMAGLQGVVQQVYENDVAVQVDHDSMSDITADVQATATKRMREKFLGMIGEEQKKQYTKEELEFDAHYVVLVMEKDLEKA